MANCLSRFTLVRFFKKELTEAEQTNAQRHLADCAHCRAVLSEIEDNDTAFNENRASHEKRLMDALAKESESLSDAPAEFGADNVISMTRRTKKGFIYVAIPLAAAAALTLSLYFLPQFKSSNNVARNDIGYKGSFSAGIVAKRNSEQFTVAANEVLHQNDALRFRIQTSSAGYLYVFNLASDSSVTSLYPIDTNAAPKGYQITNAGEHTLEDSVVLDDAQGTEHFVFVFSDKPLNIKSINQHALAIATQKSLPSQLEYGEVQVFKIVKK